MTFEEVLDQAIAMLQRRGRVTYRTLQRQFQLDDAALDDLKDALLYAHPQIHDDAGRGLVWTGDPARGHRLARRLKAGTVGINMPYTAFPGIPFGGYKQSGFGRELALETLDLYLETKSVIVNTGSKPLNPFGL